MPTRTRKFIGGVGIVAFLLFYVGLMVAIADHLPDHWAVKTVFFLVAGVAWGVPILPMLSWMNRGR